MSKVYMMVTITNRSIGSRMLSFYKENGVVRISRQEDLGGLGGR